MEMLMKKLITTLVLSLLLTVGCTNGETNENDQIQSDRTDQTESVAETEEDLDEASDNEIEDESNDSEEASTQTDSNTDLSPLTVHYIDAGQGDATLLTFADDDEEYAILYDTGDWQGSEVVPYLQNAGIEALDIVMISHPHADHIGQLADVLDEFSVGEVWMTGNTATSGVYERAAEAVLDSDADYDEPIAGDVFDIGPLTVDVLHPTNELTGGLNEDSLSVLFTYGEIEFLFTGDAYVEQEQAMLSRTDNLSADFLQLGHHGSNTSSGEQFIQAVAPTYAIYSAGDGNSYGHPHQEVLDRLNSIDAKIYGTDVHGNIIVTTDGNEVEISTETSGDVAAGTKEKQSPNDQTESESNSKNQQEAAANSNDEQPVTGDCIDINKASNEQLQEIIHLGEARATDVIELRPFESVDDLQKVDGIGPARIDDIKAENKACVGGK